MSPRRKEELMEVREVIARRLFLDASGSRGTSVEMTGDSWRLFLNRADCLLAAIAEHADVESVTCTTCGGHGHIHPVPTDGWEPAPPLATTEDETGTIPSWLEVRIIGVDTDVQHPGEEPGDVLVGGGPNRHWRLIHTSLTGSLPPAGGCGATP